MTSSTANSRLLYQRRRLFQSVRLPGSSQLYIQANMLQFPGNEETLAFHLGKLGVPELADYLVWIPFENLVGVQDMGGAAGTGFTTTVFRATVKGADPQDGRVLVLKELHESMACELLLATHLSYHCTFLATTRLLGITYNPDSSTYLTISPLASQGDLDAYLLSHPSLPPPLTTWSHLNGLAIDIGINLLALHQQGIAHGDLHPGNVLFHHADIPLVVDVSWGDATARLHNDPGVYGRLAYLPPEIFRNPHRPYTRQSDVYCLGTLLWQIITGVPPRGHAGEFSSPDQPREVLPPGIPDVYKTVIYDCWNPDPRKRPTAQEVCSRLVLAQDELRDLEVSAETREHVAARRAEYFASRRLSAAADAASRFYSRAELFTMAAVHEEDDPTWADEDDDDDAFSDSPFSMPTSSQSVTKEAIEFLSSEEVWPSPHPSRSARSASSSTPNRKRSSIVPKPTRPTRPRAITTSSHIPVTSSHIPVPRDPRPLQSAPKEIVESKGSPRSLLSPSPTLGRPVSPSESRDRKREGRRSNLLSPVSPSRSKEIATRKKASGKDLSRKYVVEELKNRQDAAARKRSTDTEGRKRSAEANAARKGWVSYF